MYVLILSLEVHFLWQLFWRLPTFPYMYIILFAISFVFSKYWFKVATFHGMSSLLANVTFTLLTRLYIIILFLWYFFNRLVTHGPVSFILEKSSVIGLGIK